jgi:hypothetical protein
LIARATDINTNTVVAQIHHKKAGIEKTIGCDPHASHNVHAAAQACIDFRSVGLAAHDAFGLFAVRHHQIPPYQS